MDSDKNLKKLFKDEFGHGKKRGLPRRFPRKRTPAAERKKIKFPGRRQCIDKRHKVGKGKRSPGIRRRIAKDVRRRVAKNKRRRKILRKVRRAGLKRRRAYGKRAQMRKNVIRSEAVESSKIVPSGPASEAGVFMEVVQQIILLVVCFVLYFYVI
ncbi:uncharacterized protein LOC119661920 [Teleopsis dalmanni]|uniref:uncharacterized protein LOC119661920 n=1 Tax=Teleopsis dalmanni TaxID=139649 RepID=UPI0018CE85F4|nr:uncharacterized protein LOC119661920 [Teleopsis dalmanni]